MGRVIVTMKKTKNSTQKLIILSKLFILVSPILNLLLLSCIRSFLPLIFIAPFYRIFLISRCAVYPFPCIRVTVIMESNAVRTNTVASFFNFCKAFMISHIEQC